MPPQPNFTILGAGSTITLPTGKAFMILATVLIIGTIGCAALILAAVFLVAELLNLAIGATVALVSHVALVYSQADSLSKVLVWLAISLLLIKAGPHLARSVRSSLAQMRGR